MTNLEILEVIRKSSNRSYEIVGFRAEEAYKYNVGDFCKNSYEYNEELGMSSYDTDEPIEMDGVCTIGGEIELSINDTDEALAEIEKLRTASKVYGDNIIVVICRGDYTYGNDEGEWIMENAEVICIL